MERSFGMYAYDHLGRGHIGTSAVAPQVVQRQRLVAFVEVTEMRRERQRRRGHTVEAVEDEAVNGRSKK
jgi:hypothetical protein